MYGALIGGIYGLSALIKNKVMIILLMIFGIVYFVFNNWIGFDILKYIDFNCILVFICSFYLSKLFIETKFLNYLIGLIVEKCSSYRALFICLIVFVFFVSGLVNSTVLFGILVSLFEDVFKRNNIKFSFFIENVIISSIIGSMSTFIGSDYSIMVSSYLNMNFLDFFFFDSRIGIYIISLFMLLIQIFYVNYFIKDEYFMGICEEIKVNNKYNVYLFFSYIILLLVASLFRFEYLSGIFSVICIVIGLIKNKKSFCFDYNFIIYILLFIYIGLMKNMDFINVISNFFVNINSTWLVYSLFFILSIILSFIFNPIFVFYFLVLLIPNIVINTDLISMPLIYSVYFGLMAGLFKKNVKGSYGLISLMFLCSYIIIAFLYF